MDDWLVCMLESDETVQRYAPSWMSIVDLEDNMDAGPARPRKEAEFTLFYYPHCFYSQKIMMILTEKECKFHEHLVNINLGEQFHEEFVRLNPEGEVPVLLDRHTHHHIVDSITIAEYLEQKYASNASRSMTPADEGLKTMHDELLAKLNGVNIEALTYGSVIFPMEQLGIIEPKHPYNSRRVREQMRETIENRTALLRTEALKLQRTNPEAYEAISDKIHGVHRDLHIIKDIGRYFELVIQVESVLDDCEKQLSKHPDYGRGVQWDRVELKWLFTKRLTLADVTLAILLFRLWQLGYSEKMWVGGLRPNIERYFNCMKDVPSFQKATGLDEEQFYWPYYFALGSVVLGIVMACFYWKRGSSSPSN